MILFLHFSSHSVTCNVEASHTQVSVISKQSLFCNQNAYQSLILDCRKHFLNFSLPPSLFLHRFSVSPEHPAHIFLTAIFILFGHYRFLSVGSLCPEGTLCPTHLDSLSQCFPNFKFAYPKVENFAKSTCQLYCYLFNIFI